MEGYPINVSISKEPKLINSKPFTIDDFKPFDKVLVRTSDKGTWFPDFYSRYIIGLDDEVTYIVIGVGGYKQCIPYNDETKSLLGTTKEYNGKYKTW